MGVGAQNRTCIPKTYEWVTSLMGIHQQRVSLFEDQQSIGAT